MYERAVVLNELAQGIRPVTQGVDWFAGLASEEQFEALRDLAGFCIQARATSEDGAESIRRAGIRPTHTPQQCWSRVDGSLTNWQRSSTCRRASGSRHSGCWSRCSASQTSGGGLASASTGAAMPGTTWGPTRILGRPPRDHRRLCGLLKIVRWPRAIA